MSTSLPRGERGTVSVEAALLVPVLVLVGAMFAAGWRVWWAGSQVQGAADAAARAASIAASPQQGHQSVGAVVGADLDASQLRCRSVSLTDDVTALALPLGTPGTVRVQVACTVDLADLLLPMPGTITVVKDATAAVDPFRRKVR